METVSCLVCRSHAWVPAVESQDFLHHLPGTFTVARCQACGFMATNPRPDAEEIRAYYPEEYGPYQLNQERVAKHVGFRKRFPFLYQLVEPHIFVVAKEGEADRELNILEIGCGAGNFLYELKLRFPRWHLSGTDFSQASIERLQQEGIAAYVSDLRTLREADRSQDVVYGFMIIEHLHFLEETLAEVQRVLKDDGHFEATLTTIMERNGFVCERVVYHRTLQDSSFSLCNAIRESVLPAAFKRALLSIVRWRTLYHFLTLPLAYLQAWTKESPGMTFVFRKSA
jgi:trans-aconitate methyltransferase